MFLWPIYIWAWWIAMGCGVGAGVWDYVNHKKNNDKRDGAFLAPAEHKIIYHFNTTALCGQDIAVLHGLRMDVSFDATAQFSIPGLFNVSGEITGLEDEPTNGLMSGEFEFVVPEIILAPVQGTWLTVPRVEAPTFNHTVAKVFETVYKMKQEILQKVPGHTFDKSMVTETLANLARIGFGEFGELV